MEKIRSYFTFLFPGILAIAAVLLFYWWMTEQRAIFLVCFMAASATLVVWFILHFSHASPAVKRTAALILAAMTTTFFLIGYFFYQSNRTLIRDIDLTATLQTTARYRYLTDDFFLERLKRADALKDRLTSAPLWNQAKILSGFFENQRDDYISVHILDTAGVSIASAPSPLIYHESANLRTLEAPTFGEPDFAVTFGTGVEAQLSSIKLFVPYRSGEGIDYYLLFNIRFDPLITIVKKQFPDLSYYLVRNDEILISNERSQSDRSFKPYKSTGYYQDIEHKLFITRANLTGIGWQAVTVQPLDEAFPNIVLADEALAHILLLGGLAGIAVALALSFYVSRTILKNPG